MNTPIDGQQRWLNGRLTERNVAQGEVARAIERAFESGKRFRVGIEYLEPEEHRLTQQEGDRTFTIPSGPPEERS